jgi:hypothetical protein
MRLNLTTRLAKTILILLLFFTASMRAQEGMHEVTLYAFPTMYPIRWDNPSILYRSAKHCFYKTMSLKDNYLLGHMALCLKSPLLPNKRYLAMTAANKMQRVDLILKDKIGLAILGATLDGNLETEEHIVHMIQVYSERRKLGFITFKVSESAMNRMLDFIEKFSRKNPGEVQPSKYYGGFYWPLFEDEGAGCSAFALGVLAAGNILPAEAEAWLKNVNIPMALIGGEYRDNKHIPFVRIKRAKTWYEGAGRSNVDYVNVQTYDPSVLLDWIQQRRILNDSVFVPVLQDNIPGLAIDCTSTSLPADKPYFKKREASNLFLDIYRKKLKQDASKPTP